MTGRLYVVGFGPGGKEHMTLRAVEVIESVDLVVGYTTYVRILKEHFPDKEYLSTGMTGEVERCRKAVSRAMTGIDVAIVSSGDSGIYGMSGIAYQTVGEMGADIEIETVPGVTAASMAASILGAPLMHDFAVISLSDLMTPYDTIMRRVDKAAESDMVICLYNPRSKSRPDHLAEAMDLISKHRSTETPVGIVRNASREGEGRTVTTIGEMDCTQVDMFSTVIVGNSRTLTSEGRIITPRGYDI